MSAGLGCNGCTHPTCRHAVTKWGVTDCPQCDGLLVLDQASGPQKWKMDCNVCKYQVQLGSAHAIRVARDRFCEVCACTLLSFSFNKSATPLPNGETDFTGCIRCDPVLAQRTTGVFSKQTWGKRKHYGKGRGGRRGGRGRERLTKEQQLLRHNG
jgi:DNA topoisomerase III